MIRKIPLTFLITLIIIFTVTSSSVRAEIKSVDVQFNSSSFDEIKLEGVLTWDTDAPGNPVVIILHPHPDGGGSQDIPLIRGYRDFLKKKGFSSLSFNFRGVGKSGGSFDNGQFGENDLTGALKFVENIEYIKPGSIFIFGYSYGASVGFRTALMDKRISGATLVGLPTKTIATFNSFYGINNSEVPVNILAGKKDPISFKMVEALSEYVKVTRHKLRLTMIPGAEHVFKGQWDNIFAESVRFYREVLSSEWFANKQKNEK